MFHYKKGSAYKTSADSAVLYQDVASNTLLNDVFCYFVHNLPKFQNMHPYRITPGTDIAEHVGTTYPALPGPPAVPETYLFSKELVAYLETLIAFSCYYRADDSRMAGKMEQFYTQALTRYKGFKYPDFHAYIARKMTAWYKQFPFNVKHVEVEDEAEGEGSEPEEGAVVAAPAVFADGAPGAYAMKKVAKRPVFGTGTRLSRVRPRRITWLPSRRARRAWPLLPPPPVRRRRQLLLRGREE